jgi:hypothetical protein
MHTCPDEFRGEAVQESQVIYDYDGNEMGYMVSTENHKDGLFIEARWAIKWLTLAARRIGSKDTFDFYSFLGEPNTLEWAVVAVERPEILVSVWGEQYTEDNIFHSARKRLEATGIKRFVYYNLEKSIEINGLETVMAEFVGDCPFCKLSG